MEGKEATLPPVTFLPLEYLHKAACEGDVELLRFILASAIYGDEEAGDSAELGAGEQAQRLEALLLGPDFFGRTALHKACYYRHKECVAELLAFGEILSSLRRKAEMDIEEEQNQEHHDQEESDTPRTWNDLTIVDCTDDYMATPLHYAAYGGDVECLKLLLPLRRDKSVALSKEEALITQKHSEGTNPWHLPGTRIATYQAKYAVMMDERTTNVSLSYDKMVAYHHDRGFGSVVCNVGVPANESRWYYEVTLLTDGLCQIGWSTDDTLFFTDAGVGDGTTSYAFDGFRCKKWHGFASAAYGEPWKAGDVVGCELDRKNNTISFYLNGKNLGVAFEDVDEKLVLHPAASISRFCGCSFNFGRRRMTSKPNFVHHEVYLKYLKKKGLELPSDDFSADEKGKEKESEDQGRVYKMGEIYGEDFKFAPPDTKSLWDLLPEQDDWMIKHWQLREHYNTFVPPPLELKMYSMWGAQSLLPLCLWICANKAATAEMLSLVLEHDIHTKNHSSFSQQRLFFNLFRNGDDPKPAQHIPPLHAAAFFGNVDCLRYLLKNYPRFKRLVGSSFKSAFFVDSCLICGYTPLHMAVLGNNLDCVKVLVEEGNADLGISDWWDGMNVLHAAAQIGSTEMTEYFLGLSRRKDIKNKSEIKTKVKQKKVDTRDFYWNTPLIHAAKGRHLDLLQFLMNPEGFSDWLKNKEEILQKISEEIQSGNPTLVLAEGQKKKQAKAARGVEIANIHANNANKRTALQDAVNDGFYDVAKMLLEEASRRGGQNEVRAMLTWADVNGNTPFHAACSHGSLPCVKLLFLAARMVGIKVDMDLRNGKEQTLLYFAAHSGKEVMSYLLSHGAEMANVDGTGKTPLHVCALLGNVEGARLLLDPQSSWARGPFRVDVDAIDRMGGSTPLQVAVMSMGQNAKMVSFLLDNRADWRKKLGHTPVLHCAAWNGSLKAMVELLNRGLPVNEKDGCSRTAFEVAFANGYTELVEAMLLNRKDMLVSLGVTHWQTHTTGKVYGVDENHYAKTQHTATLVKEGSQQKLIIIGGHNYRMCFADVHVLKLPHQWVHHPCQSSDRVLARRGHTATLVEDTIFIFGGTEFVNRGGGENDIALSFLNDLHIMDTSTYNYMKPFVLGTPPSPRQGHSATLVGRKIWFIGGSDSNTFYMDIYTFDIDTFEWAQLPIEAPKEVLARYSHTAVLIGKNIWVYGGYTGVVRTGQGLTDVPTDHNWHYVDTETMKWHTVSSNKTTSPIARTGHTATLVGDSKIYVLGGKGHRDEFNELWVFDTATRKWEKSIPLSTAYHGQGPCGHTTTLVDDHLLVYGGQSSNEVRDSMYTIDIGLVSRYGQDMKKLYDKKDYADVIFTFKEQPQKVLYGHKVILAHHSTYFASLFGKEKQRKGKKAKHPTTIQIEDVRFEVFEKLLEFLYTWKCNIEDVPEITIEKGKQVVPPTFILEMIEACKRYAPTASISLVQSIFKAVNYPHKQGDRIDQAVNSIPFSDIKLVCQNGELYAHKIILSRCEYFMALLRMQSGAEEIMSFYNEAGDRKDKEEDEEEEEEEVEVLYLNEVAVEVLFPILTALYTGKVETVEYPDLYVPLLVATDEFGVEEAREWCEREIIKNVEPESAVFLFRLSDLHNAPTLRRFCFNYILANFEEINKISPILFEEKRDLHASTQGTALGAASVKPEDLLLTPELRAEITKEIKEISRKKKILLERYENANELYYEAQILSGQIVSRKEIGKACLGVSIAGLLLGVSYWLADY